MKSKPVTLRIYREPSGQWAGLLIIDGEKVGRVAGGASPLDVERAARDTGLHLAQIEIEAPS